MCSLCWWWAINCALSSKEDVLMFCLRSCLLAALGFKIQKSALQGFCPFHFSWMWFHCSSQPVHVRIALALCSKLGTMIPLTVFLKNLILRSPPKLWTERFIGNRRLRDRIRSRENRVLYRSSNSYLLTTVSFVFLLFISALQNLRSRLLLWKCWFSMTGSDWQIHSGCEDDWFRRQAETRPDSLRNSDSRTRSVTPQSL